MEILLFGLCLGVILAIPLSWVLGMFNPIGYLGVPPWRVPASARERCPQHGQTNCFCRKGLTLQ